MRTERYSDLLPASVLADAACTVVGVGAIGRQVALQLAAMGIAQVQLVDFDTIEEANLGTQAYLHEDLGQSKVAATAALMRRLNPLVNVQTVSERFYRSLAVHRRLFCCVDSIQTRRVIFDAVHNRVDLFVDGRMAAEVLRVLAMGPGSAPDAYRATLFAPEDTLPQPCTARSTLYCAAVAAGIMVGQLSRFLRGLPVDGDLMLNLLSAELVAH